MTDSMTPSCYQCKWHVEAASTTRDGHGNIAWRQGDCLCTFPGTWTEPIGEPYTNQCKAFEERAL